MDRAPLPVGSFDWAAHLVRALHDAGIRHAVISPGSRSTPLTMALAVHPGIRTQVALDERSAAFMALGIGKSAPRPAALICTSGTAAANYLPALWEARNSGTPMLVLTADRPPSLRATGASQTIDQLKLYGQAVVFFHECGEPQAETSDLRRLSRAAHQAVAESMAQGGPAHLNLPFRKPFEPTPESLERVREQFTAQTQASVPAGGGHTGNAPAAGSTALFHDGARVAAAWSLDELPVEMAQILSRSRRPLVVAGPMNPSDPLHAEVARWIPAASEPQKSGSEQVDAAGGGSVGGAFKGADAAFRCPAPVVGDPASPGWAFATRLPAPGSDSFATPDLLIRVGDTPFSAPMLAALDAWSEVPTLLIHSRPTWQDPFSGQATRMLTGSAAVLRSLVGSIGAVDPAWTRRWEERAHAVRAELEKAVSTDLRPGTDGLTTDLQAMHGVWQEAPADWPVFLGNSLIPRDAALLGPVLRPRTVLGNRGAAGIDGILSTAAGVSSAIGSALIVFTGDLGFLHDANALLLHHSLDHPVLVALIDNGGGSIFDLLPVATAWPDGFDRYFRTPQRVDFAALCQAHGVPYQCVQPRDDGRPGWEPEWLSDWGNGQVPSPGFHVLHLRTDREASHRQRRDLQAKLDGRS